MVEKTRDIYIRINKINDIIETLEKIDEKNSYLKNLFKTYDNLNIKENNLFENWNNNMEEIVQKIEHVSL